MIPHYKCCPICLAPLSINSCHASLQHSFTFSTNPENSYILIAMPPSLSKVIFMDFTKQNSHIKLLSNSKIISHSKFPTFIPDFPLLIDTLNTFNTFIALA